MISLGRPDVGSPKARDVYDGLDTIGTILTCCPGLLAPGATAAAAAAATATATATATVASGSPHLPTPPHPTLSQQDMPPPLPTCGLLHFSMRDRSSVRVRGSGRSGGGGSGASGGSSGSSGSSGNSRSSGSSGRSGSSGSSGIVSGGGSDGSSGTSNALPDDSIVGCEITILYSVALRAARMPSKALLALDSAFELSTEMAASRRAVWEREVAMVLLQMGRLGEAALRLKNALDLARDDLRGLQLLGAALVAQGSVAQGKTVVAVVVVVVVVVIVLVGACSRLGWWCAQ